MIRILTFLICALLSLSSFAVDFTDGDFRFSTNVDGTTCTVKATTLTSGALEIPSTATNNGTTLTVTVIGERAFYNCSGFTGPLAIPSGVTKIGASAFRGCSGLTGSLTIPDGVTSIGSSAFYGCSSLTGALNIPNGVTTIENSAFYGCSSLTGALTIPSGVTKIGASAFRGCSGLTGSLTIPDGVTSIGNSAFEGCSNLTGSLTIPSGVTSIGNSAFEGCSSLTGSLTIPDGVTSIENYAFYGCSSLNGTLTIPSGVTSIGNSAFSGCSSLTGSLTIPDGVTSIGNSAFYGCSGLTGSLTIPDGVTSIGSSAFYRCTGLSGQLNIPTGVKVIEKRTFYDCRNLSGSISIPNTVEKIEEAAFYQCWGLTGNLNIPNSVNYIGQDAFYDCHGLSGRLVLSESLDTLRSGIFYNCGFTGELIIPEKICYIEDVSQKWNSNGTFAACRNLSSIIFHNKLRYIGNSAFQYCSGITGKLSIPNSVEYIGTYAFSACKNISDLDIGCDNISSHAFSYCDGLTKLELREGTGNFGNAFFMCQNLEYVHLPSTVTSLSVTAFDHCVNLREINLEYIRSFGKWAFSACGNLSITLNLENCEAIGEAAFSGCHNLAGHLVLPATLQSVAGKAFYGCGSLQAPTISYNNTPPTLAVNAFEGLYALEDDKDIYVPKESVLAYKSAEVWKDYNIQPIPDTELVLDRNTLELIAGKAEKIEVKLMEFLKDPADVEVDWSSSNEKVARVDIDGKVTANAKGTAVITATTKDGSNLSASCTVTVLPLTTTINGIIYEIVPGENGGDDTAKITDGSGATGEVKIPAAVEIDGNTYPVTEVGDGAFKDNAEITRLVIPASIVRVGDEAYAGCTKLVDVVAQDGSSLLTFGVDAFRNAPIGQLYRGRPNTGNPFAGKSTITTLTIGKEVSEIKDGEFAGCSGLTAINVYNPVPPTITDNCFDSQVYAKAALTVPDGSIDDYKAADGWKNFYIINSTNEIRVTAITIRRAQIELTQGKTEQLIAYITPDNATNKAVEWLTSDASIANVDTDGKVLGVRAGQATIIAKTTDGSNRTAKCTVSVVPRTETIGGIIVEVVPGGGEDEDDVVKVIGGNPDGDGTLTIPDEVEIDGKKYPVTEIGNGAFKDCTDITKVIIPETVIKVGDEAFSGCTNLKEVVEEDGDKTLVFGNNVFDKAPVGTVYQGRENEGKPYSEKDTLTSLTIGDKVGSINNIEFAGCSNISDISVLNPVPPTLPDDAFDGKVYKHATLRVPDGKVDDYKAADGWRNFFTIIEQNEVPATTVVINLEAAEVEEGSSVQLTAILTPDNVTYKSVTWSTSDASIATVDDNGKVTGVKAGIATITATTTNGLTATCKLVVKEKVVECYGISLNLESAEVEEGSSLQLIATVIPDNATDKSVTWSTSDASITTVDSNGKVTGVKAGIATITATTTNGLTATCKLVVKEKVVECYGISLNLESAEVEEGSSLQLIATVIPDNATDKSVSWSTSDASIATVDASGKVTGVKEGSVNITAKTANGLTATCKVTVKAKADSAIDGVESDGISVSAENGVIVISAPEDATVKVYAITGALFRSTREHRIIGLSRGVYVVRVAGKVFKVSI